MCLTISEHSSNEMSGLFRFRRHNVDLSPRDSMKEFGQKRSTLKLWMKRVTHSLDKRFLRIQMCETINTYLHEFKE